MKKANLLFLIILFGGFLLHGVVKAETIAQYNGNTPTADSWGIAKQNLGPNVTFDNISSIKLKIKSDSVGQGVHNLQITWEDGGGCTAGATSDSIPFDYDITTPQVVTFTFNDNPSSDISGSNCIFRTNADSSSYRHFFYGVDEDLYTNGDALFCTTSCESDDDVIDAYFIIGQDESDISITGPLHNSIVQDFGSWGVSVLSENSDAWACIIYDNEQDGVINYLASFTYKDCIFIGVNGGSSTLIPKSVLMNSSPSHWEAIAEIVGSDGFGSFNLGAVYTFSDIIRFSITPYITGTLNPNLPTADDLDPSIEGSFWFIDCSGYSASYFDGFWFASDAGGHFFCDLQAGLRSLVYNLIFPHDFSTTALSNSIIYLQHGFPFNIVTGIKDAIIAASEETLTPENLESDAVFFGSSVTVLTPTSLEDVIGEDKKDSIFSTIVNFAWVGAAYIMWVTIF
ncbi:hypothetical protein A2954_02150 [Candidatus Roizmanbacteria bacterium RIFCSPLOWO2_01_FULL_37_12]|uniref:Uncharacterized protein n=2 Tax=Microgenomates group TaxID=1794810 RepID=A0A1F7IB11_9BACT|nr:MAG: hypothetical protein A2777_03770 [Candidatus Gottesmanbacteria bacterium RIFCSPHIGHO2_01_FULL_40_15]OGK40553.1 MAG: hypothetical protein A2954_02150 [Candidatus Roizmanbacteria bacterium RIFCSPLOWO2_01_FULL_37_12]